MTAGRTPIPAGGHLPTPRPKRSIAGPCCGTAAVIRRSCEQRTGNRERNGQCSRDAGAVWRARAALRPARRARPERVERGRKSGPTTRASASRRGGWSARRRRSTTVFSSTTVCTTAIPSGSQSRAVVVQAGAPRRRRTRRRPGRSRHRSRPSRGRRASTPPPIRACRGADARSTSVTRAASTAKRA